MQPAKTSDATHCAACGCYMPMTLDGSARVHDCDRTPPLDGLPTTIFACPICGGHGASRWGCWGTQTYPHEHAYMLPIHEIIRTARRAGARHSGPCVCAVRCGDRDPDGAGVCKGLPS